MNSFTQLVILSQTRGLIKTWPPRIGARSVL
jgi:type VI protein secretion system component VasA